MSKIDVKQTSIIINDYNLGDTPNLEGSFKIYDQLTHSEYSKAIEYNEETKQLFLPRGIDIYYLENIFDCRANILKNKHDPYDRITPIKLKYSPRDDVQKEALSFMIGELKYKSTKSNSQLSVNLPTGKGKSYCSIATASFFSYRTAIIASRTHWLEQWKNYILDYTDTKPREIFEMVGSSTIHRFLNKDISQYKFILISHSTISSYAGKYGWEKVEELFKKMRIGIKIYDEAHASFDNICSIDFHSNTYKTYYLTATPLLSNERENVIYQLYFKNIPAIGLFDKEKDPHTHYLAFRYNSGATPLEISDCKNAYGLDRNKYTDYVVHKPNFYMMLRLLMDLISKVKGKVLIYIGTNYAIKVVYNWLVVNYPEYINDIGIYTSIITENKKEQLNNKIILSTTKSLGAAQDIKGLKMTIVLAEPFKSEVIAKQSLGRTRDDNTHYIEIVDDDFYYVKKYYNNKKHIFAEYALDCKEIKIKTDELIKRNEDILYKRNIIINQYLLYPIQILRPNELITPITQMNGLITPIKILRSA